jgi:hypothetical protein
MSTQAYRRRLKSSGMNIENKDIDHIIPKSKGGADHPANSQLWDASKNRSCGAGCLGEKFLNSPLRYIGALAISAIVALNCGG